VCLCVEVDNLKPHILDHSQADISPDGGRFTPPCDRCVQADEACLQKAQGPGCQCCVQRKVGCSLVRIKQRIEKKEGKQRLVSEGGEENSAAPMMELLDGFMEQMEAMAKELKNISGGIWVLVEGIRRLTEVVEEIGKEEVRKEDKETETEDVQRMDKQTEMEEKEGDDGEESGSEGDRMEDGEEGGDK
jgi:hypothetical protein